MGKFTITLDGKTASAELGQTILEAALDNGVYIPHLCGHGGLAPAGACGMCAVKIKGTDGVTMACSTLVSEGLDIDTRDEMAEKIRKLACDFIFKTHPSDCTGCPKYGKCQLQTISQYVGDTGRKLRDKKLLIAADEKNPIILHEMHRCILCGRCVRICTDVRGVGAIRFEKVKGRMRVVVCGENLTDAGCRYCSACVDVCPTGSIREHEAIAAKMEGKTREAAVVPCKDACPAKIDIPRYIRHISDGDCTAATAVVREKAPFPGVLGYICTHPCEPECKRGYINSPVSICGLKRFAAQNGADMPAGERENPPPTGKRAAIIGAGPAGLTAAFFLARKGHEVTVFEAYEQAGGMLRCGIPGHRLPRDILDDEITAILSAGVSLKTNQRIENAPSLLKQGFDAVFAAIGAHRGMSLAIPGTDLAGVYVSTGFLRLAAAGTPNPAAALLRVMVLGGGDVAIDCAAVARRLGAAEVHLACLESYDAMTSSKDERAWSEEEGLIIHNGKTFLEIIGSSGRVVGMKLASVSGFRFDENGKSVVDVIPNSEEIIEVDAVVFAIGQRPDVGSEFGLDIGQNGGIAASDECATNVSGVFAAGDAVTGTASVIKAIAGARTAAEKMDIYLGGNGYIDDPPLPPPQRNPYLGKKKDFGIYERSAASCLHPEERSRCFDIMELGLSGEQAACEAGRCLQCDLRLDIAPQRFWTDYSNVPGGEEI